MAKLRRVIRKVPPRGGGDYFDEKVWPVHIALVVLGGFLMGVSAAYQQFLGVPWYRSAITSLVAIPLVIGGFMLAFRLIDSQWLRRSMQFSIVIAAIIHVLLVVQLRETILDSLFQDDLVADREIIEARPAKLIPEYRSEQLVPEQDRPREDHEKPIETETPEPVKEPVPVERQETKPEVPQAPKQPIPVPEPVATTEPNIVKRPQPNEAAPKQAAQTSKLSKQSKPSEMKISQLVQTPQVETPKVAGAEAKPTTAKVERQTTEPTKTASNSPAEPTTTVDAQTAQLAKKTAQESPVAESSSTPTLKRQVATPAQTPRSQVAAADAPPASKETSPTELTPANTESIKRTTASPEVARATAEPVPDVSAQPVSQPQKRQLPSEVSPTVAQSPATVPNKQPRTTARPDVATTAAVATPQPDASPSTNKSTELAPQTARVEKATAQVASSKPADSPATAPNSPQTDQPAARVARVQASDNPAATANPTAMATLTRQTGAPSIPSATKIEPAATATSSASASVEIAATSTATRRQATSAEQTSPAVSEPSPATFATANPAPPTDATVRRATSSGQPSSDSPALAQAAGTSPAASRNTKSAVANVVTTVGDVPTNAGPQTASSGVPGPSSTSVSKQLAANNPAASRTQPAAEAQSAQTASQVSVTSGGSHASNSSVPTISPNADAGASPARALASAPTATSPSALDSPATAIAASASSDPASQPSRLALSKSQAGIAGVGRSANIDSALPGGDSPAMVASGAARRAQATQENPAGDALSPSAPAQIARSRAGATAPSASAAADATDLATTAGAPTPSEVAASSSASLTRADATATQGDVTAAKGTAEVDLGPTQVVAETGEGRAAGGGQAEMNFDTPAAQPARKSAAGGAPLMSLAGAKVDESVAAPMGDSGGQPQSVQATNTATGRMVTGEPSVATGGPSAAMEKGPLAETTSAQELAKSDVSRADDAEGSAGAGAAGQPTTEDEEEKARRLARAAAGGAPQLAIGGPIMADKVTSPLGEAGDGGAPKSPDVSAVATSTARQQVDGGAPSGGTPIAAGDLASAAGSSGAEAVSGVSVTRAEATEGSPGTPTLGGGTAAPAKAASGPTFSATTTAETVQLAGAPQSSGTPDGAPLEARGTQTGKVAGGTSGAAADGGAVAGEEVIAASALAPAGSGGGKRQAGPASSDGPAIGDVAMQGAPGQRAATATAPAAGGTLAEVPEIGPQSAVAQAELDHMMGGMGNTPMTKQSGEALAVSIEAPEGPGGVGQEYTPEVGLATRQSRSESVQVQAAAARFVKQAVGGLPSLSSAALVSTEPFMRRANRKPGTEPGGGGKGVLSPETEVAIEQGLQFLARHQLQDGNWSLQGFDETTDAVSSEQRKFMLVSDTGATALAILAFQGGGYTHREYQYKDVVRKGLEHLIKNQKDNGDLFVPLDDRSNQSVWLYSHALASIALCEAYGMTQDPALREPAQKAVDFIIASQSKDLGGWRYAPGVGTDTSVTGWMMMALKSGELAGLTVPKESYTRIEKWLNVSQGSAVEPHLYRYNPYAPDTAQQRHGRVNSKTMTAVGLLMRLYTGWEKDNPKMVHGAEFLKANLPLTGTAREPLRDTYYWYYATQVMCHMEGSYWESWKGQLFPLLRDTQVKSGPWSGSWNPGGAVPDRWALHAGRLYVTTMNLLSLEVEYRKLPLYVDLRKEKK